MPTISFSSSYQDGQPLVPDASEATVCVPIVLLQVPSDCFYLRCGLSEGHVGFSRCWNRATESSAHSTSFSSLGAPIAGSNLSMIPTICSPSHAHSCPFLPD